MFRRIVSDIMGCCYSFFCKEEGTSQNCEPNERTHLLIDPVSNSANLPRHNSDDLFTTNSATLPKKTDEQSALNRILQETATNVIDVGALDSHNLQQHEYLERMKQYTIKLQQACVTNRLTYKNKQMLLQDVPSVDKILSTNPINVDNYNLITMAVSKASSAIADIKVEHKDDLVVPFRIP